MVVNKNLPAEEIIEFRNKRSWEEAHSPTNLAKSIIIEAAELLEHYQWGDQDINIEGIKEELADIFIYSITLAETLNLNINDIIIAKIKINEKKYPLK